MASSIRLGKLFGIEIGINWSLVFVFALITWTIATEVLPIDVPGQGALAYWVAGVVGSIAFYACLLAHELAHALVARRYGVKVGGITLWLFGGVARLDGEPPSAGTEGLIAFGVFELFTGAVLNGIWIGFVGWFLLSAGSSEDTGAAVRGILRSVPVAAAMSSPVVTVPDWLTVDQFVQSIA